jgi:hypothetical protein
LKAGELHNPKAILANSNKPYLVINAVLEQSSCLIFTCQYAELASSLEYHTFENGKREIPEHLINLFDKCKGELNEQEQTQFSELLCGFEDVFAKSEFDLGKSVPYIPLLGTPPSLSH